MNFNKVFILGNLTRDPEVRTTPNGQSVAQFGVATNRIWFDKNRQKQTEVEFHNVVVWGRLAEVAGRYLNKGKMVFIEGRIKTRTWQDQSGQKRSRTEIIAENFQMGPRAGEKGGDFSGPESESSEGAEEMPVISEEYASPEDLPF